MRRRLFNTPADIRIHREIFIELPMYLFPWTLLRPARPCAVLGGSGARRGRGTPGSLRPRERGACHHRAVAGRDRPRLCIRRPHCRLRAAARLVGSGDHVRRRPLGPAERLQPRPDAAASPSSSSRRCSRRSLWRPGSTWAVAAHRRNFGPRARWLGGFALYAASARAAAAPRAGSPAVAYCALLWDLRAGRRARRRLAEPSQSIGRAAARTRSTDR